MTKNRVTVRINGSEYTLTGEETEDYLFSIANFVDKKVKEILGGNPKHSNTSAAILAALTITDELFATRREVEVLKRSLNEPERKIKQLTSEYEKLGLEYSEAVNQIEAYKSSLGEKEEDINTLKKEYSDLYGSFMKKNDEHERLIKENAFLKEENEKHQNELKQTSENIIRLKDQLLESQIELVRVQKDFKDLKETYSKKRGL